MKIAALFLFYFGTLNQASVLSGIGKLFKGKQGFKDTIKAGDKNGVLSILRLRKCEFLLQDQHEILRFITHNNYHKMMHSIFNNVCIYEENFMVKAVQSALRYSDEAVLELLLDVLRERPLEFHNYLVGGVFESCVMAKHLGCVENMIDWHVPLTTGGRNILHLAAKSDDLKILKLAPKDEVFLDKRDNVGYFPMNYVTSKEMAQALLDRWDEEPKKLIPSQACVLGIHSMAGLFNLPDKTLSLRVHYAAVELQQRIDREDPFELNVSRKTIFHDSYKSIHGKNVNVVKYFEKFWYRPELNVHISFVGESGIDAGGPRLEWLGEMIKAMFNPNPDGKVEDFTLPLFTVVDEESGMYAPNLEYVSHENFNDSVYKFAGSIVALAFRDKLSLKVKFIPAITKALANGRWKKYDPIDFAAQHPQTYRGLINLQSMEGDKLEEALEAADLEFISRPGRKVTKDNLDKYIVDVGSHYLYRRYKKAIEAFAEGFRSIHSHRKSVPFTHMELADVLRGGEQTFDLEKFEKICLITGSEESKTIFWQMMGLLTEEEKMKFFKFVTGRASIPFEGFSGLKDKIQIQLDKLAEGFWPSAATCFSRVSFPENLKSAEEMKEKLFRSINVSGNEFSKE